MCRYTRGFNGNLVRVDSYTEASPRSETIVAIGGWFDLEGAAYHLLGSAPAPSSNHVSGHWPEPLPLWEAEVKKAITMVGKQIYKNN